MQTPVSQYFTPLSLNQVFNHDRSQLDSSLRLRQDPGYGSQVCRGMPFDLARRIKRMSSCSILMKFVFRSAESRLLMSSLPISLKTSRRRYRRIWPIMMARRDSPSNCSATTWAPWWRNTSWNMPTAAPSQFRFAGGFAIQQAHIGWGASPFAAVPHQKDTIISTVSESLQLGRMPASANGRGETRHQSGRDAHSEHIWLYALPNPFPDKAITAIRCIPKGERALIYGISTTQVSEHPLRAQTRRKLALTLPETVTFNAIGELDQVDIDLGYVISARAQLIYDRDAWFGEAVNVQPRRSERVAIIEYAAHPEAKMHLRGTDDALFSYDLGSMRENGTDRSGGGAAPDQGKGGG